MVNDGRDGAQQFVGSDRPIGGCWWKSIMHFLCGTALKRGSLDMTRVDPTPNGPPARPPARCAPPYARKPHPAAQAGRLVSVRASWFLLCCHKLNPNPAQPSWKRESGDQYPPLGSASKRTAAHNGSLPPMQPFKSM